MTTLLEVASLQARWLAARQSVTATNIANVSTPGYAARDVTAFEDALRNAAVTPGATRTDAEPWQVRPSGNSVTLEEELIRGGSITRAYALNTGIVSSFHRMFLSAARG
jgi:flagellar basal-body rod protein FlgB